MIDPFDYKEPQCPLCGGEEFYGAERRARSVPIMNITEKLDSFFSKEDYRGAKKLLEYWLTEAREIGDERGELSLLSEVMGLSRRIGEREWGMDAVRRGTELCRSLGLADSVSGATVLLNAATTMKAFGEAEESIPYYEDVRTVYEKYLDPDDERFGGLYNNMALALADCGRYGEAEDAYEKALVVMSSKKNGALESAITLINMAELYERALDDSESAVGRCMDQAYECLKTPGVDHDGYYAFVCRKCAPSFGHFGYFAAQRELDAAADEIYAGN